MDTAVRFDERGPRAGEVAGGQGVRRAYEKPPTCVYIIGHSPNMVQRPFVELDVRTDAVLFPKAAARLKEGPRSCVVRDASERIALALGPRGNHGNLP